MAISLSQIHKEIMRALTLLSVVILASCSAGGGSSNPPTTLPGEGGTPTTTPNTPIPLPSQNAGAGSLDLFVDTPIRLGQVFSGSIFAEADAGLDRVTVGILIGDPELPDVDVANADYVSTSVYVSRLNPNCNDLTCAFPFYGVVPNDKSLLSKEAQIYVGATDTNDQFLPFVVFRATVKEGQPDEYFSTFGPGIVVPCWANTATPKPCVEDSGEIGISSTPFQFTSFVIAGPNISVPGTADPGDTVTLSGSVNHAEPLVSVSYRVEVTREGGDLIFSETGTIPASEAFQIQGPPTSSLSLPYLVPEDARCSTVTGTATVVNTSGDQVTASAISTIGGC